MAAPVIMQIAHKIWEAGMARKSALVHLLDFVSWVHSIFNAIPRYLASRRDRRLKKYLCTLEWLEGENGYRITVKVKAENQDQARQFANAGGIARYPKVQKKALSKGVVDPPYIKDAVGTLQRWKVEVIPLTEGDREEISAGNFGPAGAFEVGFSN